MASPKPAPAAKPTAKQKALPDSRKAAVTVSAELQTYIDAEPIRASTEARTIGELNHLVIRLKWKAISDATEYGVTVFSADGSVFKTGKVREAAAQFELRSLDITRFSYQVVAYLKSGREVRTPKIPIEIQLAPPVAVNPQSGFRARKGQEVAITWKKTALARVYRLQLARDAEFRSIVFDQSLGKNFFHIYPKNPGVFYWRVKSLSRGGTSRWSAPHWFEVK
jgi:hypothetical protein